MANDVSIIVSADLGDTLIKLDLAKHAINDLGDASEETAAKQDAASASTSLFSGLMAQLGPDAETSLPAMTTMASTVTTVGIVAGVAAVAVVALADAIGTIIAIVADLVAPLTLVTGLLGLLGAGFFLAAKQAFGMHEDGLGQAISGLKKQFDDLTTTLVGRFMPVFQFLIHNASQALDFLNRIAKLPLDQAFQQLATKGIPAVKKFLDQVGHLIAHPIRLAIQLAFGGGRGGNEAASAISQIWNEITKFFLGYTQTHKIHIGRALIVTQSEVQGALQPFIDWFNRHDFTKQGTKIGHEILNGLKPLAGPIGQFIVTIFTDAFKTVVTNGIAAFRRLVTAANAEWDHLTSELTADMHRWNSEFENFVLGPFIAGWNRIGGAINTVKGIADEFLGILHKIADFFSQTFTLHVNFPSLPSAGGIASGIGGALGSLNPFNHAAGHVVQNIHIHVNGASEADFRRHARLIGREIGRQNHILAGGQ